MKKKRGGKRSGSGAKLKYNEKTVVCSFRVPVSKKEKVVKLVRSYLNNSTFKPFVEKLLEEMASNNLKSK